MRCLLCFTSNKKLQRLQSDTGHEIIGKITFILPNFVISKSKDALFICVTCLEEVSSFCTIKKSCLKNCCRLIHFNSMLKGTKMSEFNELNVVMKSYKLKDNSNKEEEKVCDNSSQQLTNIIIKSEELEENIINKVLSSGVQDQTHVIKEGNVCDVYSQQLNVVIKSEKFEDSSNNKELLTSGVHHLTNIKEEKICDNYNQQLESDESSSDYLQDDGPSCSTNTRKTKNGGSCEFVDVNNIKEDNISDSDSASLDNINKEQHKTHEKAFKCIICGKKLTTKNNLAVHIRLHTEDKPFSCPKCPKTFTRASYLERHSIVHFESRPFQCPICQKRFKRFSHLNIHETIHTGLRPFECDLCEKKFGNKNHLKRHKLTHENKQFHQCQICNKTFKFHSNLKAHNLTPCEKQFECEDCHKIFTDNKSLLRHMDCHNNVGPYQCSECGMTFERSVDLSLHMRSHKTTVMKTQNRFDLSKKPFSCGHCEQSFSSECNLKEHKKRLHPNEESK